MYNQNIAIYTSVPQWPQPNFLHYTQNCAVGTANKEAISGIHHVALGLNSANYPGASDRQQSASKCRHPFVALRPAIYAPTYLNLPDILLKYGELF